MRRTFAALGAVAVVTAGMAMASPNAQAADPAASAGSDAGSDAGSRERAFAAASSEYGVPRTVLEAVSYAQSRWDFHPGHSTTGGYGPMHLVDADLAAVDPKGLGDMSDPAPVPDDTLSRAADLTGLPEETLRSDELANIRGGAALLAASQQRLGLPTGTGTDPGSWYAAVADTSGAKERNAAGAFADDTFAVVASGAARRTVDGKEVSLLPARTTPQKDQLDRLGLAASPTVGAVDCPADLNCEWIPATYAKTGPNPGSYVNHDLADRPRSPQITNIVIHNTEGSYSSTIASVQDPTRPVSWQYTLRSSDGHIAQHVGPQDVAWHAGNWYVNSHSIGLEHEGFAASGADWFSEPMYRTSARLVTYLAAKYNIPLDMQHVFGHDQIPGVTPANVPGMHWDPGPYWNWEHYFELLGVPLGQSANKNVKDLVRILPGFEDNIQTVTSCATSGVPCRAQGTNFVYLHTEPSESAPLVNDIGLKPSGAPATTNVSDIGARAQAGLDFAVAEVRGDWTAIWFNGVKGWFLNPASDPTAVPMRGSFVVPKPGLAKVPVYGRAYPEASAYPTGIPVQSVVPLQYTFAAGQRYAVGDLTVPTNYYRATTFSSETPNDHVDVVGQDRYYQVSFGHRFAYVRAADVDVVKAQ